VNSTPAGRRPGDALTAILLMVAACALVAGTTLIAKVLGPAGGGETPLHPFQISAGRFMFAAAALTPFLIIYRPSFAGARWTNHILRVLFGWAGVSALFAASGLMRLADANAISFLNPVVAMILSIPLLGERVGPWRWAAAAIAFAGALTIVQPGASTFQPAALIALVAAFFMGAEAILIKKLADTEPPLRILAINNFIGAILALSVASFVWVWPTPQQWLLMATLGSTMICVQALFIQALRRGDASFVMPFFYLSLIFAALYDYLVFAQYPTAASWLGAGHIIAGALTIGWRERISRRAANAAGQRFTHDPDQER
jgi:drug/metabolite transporter (DMT)-like permease